MVVVVIEVIPMKAAPMPKRVAVATVIRPEMKARWVTRKPRSICRQPDAAYGGASSGSHDFCGHRVQIRHRTGVRQDFAGKAQNFSA